MDSKQLKGVVINLKQSKDRLKDILNLESNTMDFDSIASLSEIIGNMSATATIMIGYLDEADLMDLTSLFND